MILNEFFNNKQFENNSFGNSEPEQQQMDANRRSRLGRERNAGLDEPDDALSSSAPTGNGVYEYTVPAGQESVAQELGLQQHRGHWVSRVPIQRANFQFGRPQFHEIPAKGVAEGAKWRDPKYQGKTFDYDDSYEGPQDTQAGKVSLDRAGMRQTRTFDPLEYKAREKQATGKLTPQDIKYATAKNFGQEKQQQLDYDRSRKAEQGVAEESSENKYSNLSNRGVNRGINRAGDDFNRMLDLDQAESPHYKTQHQRDTKQRLKTKPMTGPKGVLPEQDVAEGTGQIDELSPGTLNSYVNKARAQVRASPGANPNNSHLPTDPKIANRARGAVKADNRLHGFGPGKKSTQGVAEAATPASVSKVLRLIQRHHSDWFDTYGMGEVEDAVVDMAEMGQFRGTSAAVALKLVGDELESMYGAQGMAEADELRARGGLAAVNKKPRIGQTDMRDIPVGNHPDARINKFTDRDREEHPSRLKAKIKSTLGKHTRPNLPEQGMAEDSDPSFIVTFNNTLLNKTYTALVKAMDEYDAKDIIRYHGGRGTLVKDVKPARGDERTDYIYRVFKGTSSSPAGQAGLYPAEQGVTENSSVDSDGYSVDQEDAGEYDYEGDQAKDQLQTIMAAARKLNGILDDNENLPEWVQMKITKATDYLDTAADYVAANKAQSEPMAETKPEKIGGVYDPVDFDAKLGRMKARHQQSPADFAALAARLQAAYKKPESNKKPSGSSSTNESRQARRALMHKILKG